MTRSFRGKKVRHYHDEAWIFPNLELAVKWKERTTSPENGALENKKPGSILLGCDEPRILESARKWWNEKAEACGVPRGAALQTV